MPVVFIILRNELEKSAADLTCNQILSSALWFLHFIWFESEVFLHYLQLLIGNKWNLFHMIQILCVTNNNDKNILYFWNNW